MTFFSRKRFLVMFLVTTLVLSSFLALVTIQPMTSQTNTSSNEQKDTPLNSVALPSASSTFQGKTDTLSSVLNWTLAYVNKWGSYGSGAGQFNASTGIAINSTGYIYVADSNNNRIQIFRPSGSWVKSFGSYGASGGQFKAPSQITINSSGYVYVTDSTSRVQIFKSGGTFIKQFYPSMQSIHNKTMSLTISPTTGYLYVAVAVGYDIGGGIIVHSSKIQVYTAAGSPVLSFYIEPIGSGATYRIAINSTGYIYAAEDSFDQVHLYSATGTSIGYFGIGNYQFGGLAFNSIGNLYITDAANDRIMVWTRSGNLNFTYSSSGTLNGQFSFPQGIIVNSSNYIYVVDTNNNRVQVLRPTIYYCVSYSNFLAFSISKYLVINATLRFSVNVTNTQLFLFSYDSSSWIFITQSNMLNNYQIPINKFYNGSHFQFWFRFNKSTSFITKVVYNITLFYYNVVPPEAVAFQDRTEIVLAQPSSTPPSFITKWGSSGSGNGQFSGPFGIAVNSSGFVYVVDQGNNRIQVFTKAGVYVTKWGSAGTGNGQFNMPSRISINGTGFIYVTDQGNNRVQVFKPSGTFVAKWGSSGSGNGQFADPIGIVVNSSGFVYVADNGNDRIQVFTKAGVYVSQWASSEPYGVAVNDSNFVYVAEYIPRQIQVFTKSGTLITQWGSSGSGNGQFGHPYALDIDSKGLVYVVDTGNNRIQVFTAGGSWVNKWGSTGSGNGQFSFPADIAVNGTSFIYTVEVFNNRVQVFDRAPYSIDYVNSLQFSVLKPTFIGALLNFISFGSNVTFSLYNYATLSWTSLTSNQILMNYQPGINYYNGSHFQFRLQSLQEQRIPFNIRTIYNITLFYWNVTPPSFSATWTDPIQPNHTSPVQVYVNVSGNYWLDKVLLKWSADNWVTNSTWQSLLNMTTSLPTLTIPTTWKTIVAIPAQVDKTLVQYEVQMNYTIGVPTFQYLSYLVLDHVPPRFIHNQATNVKPTNHPGASMNFLNISCLVYNTFPGVSRVIFQENLTGSFINHTMANETLAKYFFYLDISSLTTNALGYRFWANDTDNNENVTQTYTIKRDFMGPMIISWTVPSKPQYSDLVQVWANFTDISGINGIPQITWSADNWAHNDTVSRTMVLQYQNTWRTNLPLPVQQYNTTVRWELKAYDLGGNLRVSYFSYRVRDLTAPSVLSIEYPSVVQAYQPFIINVSMSEPATASGIDPGNAFIVYILSLDVIPTLYYEPLFRQGITNYWSGSIPGLPLNETVQWLIFVKDLASPTANNYTSSTFEYIIIEVQALVNWMSFGLWVILIGLATAGLIAFRDYYKEDREKVRGVKFVALGVGVIVGVTALLWLLNPWWIISGLTFQQYMQLLGTEAWGIAFIIALAGVLLGCIAAVYYIDRHVTQVKLVGKTIILVS